MLPQKLWVVVIIATISLLFIYRPYFSPATSYFLSRSQNKIISPQFSLKQSLQRLVQSPILGHLFYEQLIVQLADRHEWQKVLQYTDKALEGLNTNKFVIWYHKALAQCLLSKLQDCKSSARVASGMVKNSIQYHLSQIYDLIEMLQKDQGKFIFQKNEIGDTIISYIGADANKLQKNEHKKEPNNLNKQSIKISEL